jgi:hypothetical protein
MATTSNKVNSQIGTTGIWDFYNVETGEYEMSYEGFLSKKTRAMINRMGFSYVSLSTNYCFYTQPAKRIFKELQSA